MSHEVDPVAAQPNQPAKANGEAADTADTAAQTSIPANINEATYTGEPPSPACRETASIEHEAHTDVTPASRLTSIAGQVASFILDGHSVGAIASKFGIDVQEAQELCECDLVAQQLNTLEFHRVERAKMLSKGWSGLEEVALTRMLDSVDADTPVKDLVSMGKLALDAQRNGQGAGVGIGAGAGQGVQVNLQSNSYVNLQLGGQVKEPEVRERVGVKTVSVASKETVEDMFPAATTKASMYK